MSLLDIFRAKGQHLFWERLDDAQVDNGLPPAQPIAPDEAYVVVRMNEMFLRDARVLWRKYYPMLHSYVSYRDNEEHAVAGPGQLREFGDTNLDRVVNLRYRRAGPIPYRGGDLSLLTGLYSVPGQDAAKALIDTVAVVANLGGIALGQTAKIAEAVKSGVEQIVGLNESKLQLGVRDTFTGSTNPLRPGIHIGIAADAAAIDPKQLWINNKGRLVAGEDPVAGKLYDQHDYMAVSVEAWPTRDDWAALSDIAPLNAKFQEIMTDQTTDVAAKRKKLGELWTGFSQALLGSPNLIRSDSQGIAARVSADLKQRLAAMETGNPFEARSIGKVRVPSDPSGFDMGLVSDDPVAGDTRALESNPFAG